MPIISATFFIGHVPCQLNGILCRPLDEIISGGFEVKNVAIHGSVDSVPQAFL